MILWHLFSVFHNRVSLKDGGWLGLMVLQSGFPLMMIWVTVKLVIMLLALDEFSLKGNVLLPIWFLRGLSINFKDHHWNRDFWFFSSVWTRDCKMGLIPILIHCRITILVLMHGTWESERRYHREKRNRARFKFLPWARYSQTFSNNFLGIVWKEKLVLFLALGTFSCPWNDTRILDLSGLLMPRPNCTSL